MNGMNTQGRRRAGFLGLALFYGSIWGLGEATLGHLLHLARIPGLPGLVMFPFGVLVMGRALARSGGASAVFATGVVAAGFKFLDLLLPGTDILAVINPARAILLEALAAAVWVSLTTARIEMGTFLFFAEPAGNARPKNRNVPIFPR
jgi:hypothetical protein